MVIDKRTYYEVEIPDTGDDTVKLLEMLLKLLGVRYERTLSTTPSVIFKVYKVQAKKI